MELTFEAGKNMVLVDGQVYLLDQLTAHPKGYVYQLFSDYKPYKGISEVLHTALDTKRKFYWVNTTADKKENFPSSSNWTRNILATTNTELTGVHHIPREWFVRKVDVDDILQPIYEKNKCETLMEAAHYASGLRDGYNANKAEFTREDMFEAMKYASSHLSSVKSIAAYIASLPRIEEPQSITITSDFKQKIDTIWKD